jgi:hypothetical protein
MQRAGKVLIGLRLAASVLGVGLLATMGCAHYYQLVPAPTTSWTAGPGRAAVGDADGVRMTVRAGTWNGDPALLSHHVLPLEVSIENHSGRPLRVLYGDFDVQEPDVGVRLSAIPPLKVKGSATVAEGAIAPAFPYSGFALASSYDQYAGGVPLWIDAWPRDYGSYAGRYSAVTEPLPTVDMMRAAMPEGVVQNGGRVAGFLYLQRLKKDVPRVTFVARLVDARNGQEFGRIDIPFVVRPE